MVVTNGEGEFVVAHGVQGAIITPVPLSKHVTEILESPHAEVRESGVKVLARLLEQGAPERGPTARQSGLALSARQRLHQIVEEDLPRIAQQAQAALSSAAGKATASLEPAPEAGSEIRSEPPESASGESPEPEASASPSPEAIAPTTEAPSTSLPSEPGSQPAEPGSHQAEDLTYDPDYFPALDAYFACRWDEAVDLWSVLASRHPGEAIVVSKLADARKNRDLADSDGKADAADQKNHASPAYKPGDTLNGQVLGADHAWHPLAQTEPPPRSYWKGFIGRFCWMYLVSVIIALLFSTWLVLSDYLNKVLAAPDIPVVAPSYVKQSAIIAAIVAVLMDFAVASLRDTKQRRRRARTGSHA